ncbi:MAG: DUF2066 domain-containing protein [Kiloniellales bacterium]
MVVGRPCRAATVLLFLVLPSFAWGVAGTDEDDLFTVAGVKVDATADTAAAARDVALAEGQERALAILFRRLTLRRDHARLPTPSRQRVAELVRALEIAEERTSAVRYLAEITVRFKPAEVRLALRLAGLRFAETVRRPELVLPVYLVAGTPLLWDEPNPWKAAWSAHPAGGGLVTLAVPIGDLSDMSDISAEQAIAQDATRLDAIARRYGAASTMVAIASLAMDPGAGKPVLTVVARRHDRHAGGRTIFERRFPAGGETIDHLLARAVEAVASHVEEEWKRDNVLRFDLRGRVQVSVPVSGIEEWIEVRRRLDRVPAIRRTVLRALDRNRAWLLLDYVGELRQLRLALAQHDLELTQDLGSSILRLRRAPPRESADAAGSTPLPPPGPPPQGPLVQPPQ